MEGLDFEMKFHLQQVVVEQQVCLAKGNEQVKA